MDFSPFFGTGAFPGTILTPSNDFKFYDGATDSDMSASSNYPDFFEEEKAWSDMPLSFISSELQRTISNSVGRTYYPKEPFYPAMQEVALESMMKCLMQYSPKVHVDSPPVSINEKALHESHSLSEEHMLGFSEMNEVKNGKTQLDAMQLMPTEGSTRIAKRAQKMRRYKTTMCKYFDTDACRNVDNCNFAHGWNELRLSSEPTRFIKHKKKKAQAINQAQQLNA